MSLFVPVSLPLFPMMAAVQLEEGFLEDAESQIELLSVMHNAEELSPEFLFLKSQVARLSNKADFKGDPSLHDTPL